MKNHHLTKGKKGFFEGWYLKHQEGENMISFIPGVNITEKGEKKAFIQIITRQASCVADFDIEEFYARGRSFYVKIGNNVFSGRGVHIDIRTDSVKCRGNICYGRLTALKYNIMGPFSMLPGMECNHGVISLQHKLRGSLILNGENMVFNGGTGYIEKDWGSSFPKSYTWLQCNGKTEQGEAYCVMVSIADIPFCGLEFKGFLGVVYYQNKEYRFTTYNGAHLPVYGPEGILMRRGRYVLRLTMKQNGGKKLKAPGNGSMDRVIRENISTRAEITLLKNSKTLFAAVNDRASYEHVEP